LAAHPVFMRSVIFLLSTMTLSMVSSSGRW